MTLFPGSNGDYVQPAANVTATAATESPPLLLTVIVPPIGPVVVPPVLTMPLPGMVTRNCVLDPVPCCERPKAPARPLLMVRFAAVPTDDGGVPKLLPRIVTSAPHVRLSAGTTADTTGSGTGVWVGVAVAVPGVLVAIGVSVGVAVEPSATYALKPEVMHGRSPSA